MQYRDTGELWGAHQILLKRQLPIKLCPPFASVDNFPLFEWLGSQMQAEPIKNNVDVTDEKREFSIPALRTRDKCLFQSSLLWVRLLHSWFFTERWKSLKQRSNRTIKEYRQSDLEFTNLLFDFLLFIDLDFMTSIYIFFFLA